MSHRGLAWIAALLAFCCFQQLRGQDISSNNLPATVHPLKAPGIENFYRLSERFYSGSSPEGDAAFAELKRLGVKTIITVDGTKPDVEAAQRFGLRYVHLPIGYDGVPYKQALRLVKAAKTLPGPIYVHCHHGMHRGPASAAVICMALEDWTPEQADSWLHVAGTSSNYAGLYRSVERFHPPTAEVLANVSADFPSRSPVSPLADVMIEIDGRLDNIKLIKKAGYLAPVGHPDLDPSQEALLLDELFKELLRSPVLEKRTADFKAKLAEAASASGKLQSSLSAKGSVNTLQIDNVFTRLSDDCTACHKKYRN
ncbi:MAG TPA: hypothetical protein VGO67_15290 [Verrucomicrobiae bacterium]